MAKYSINQLTPYQIGELILGSKARRADNRVLLVLVGGATKIYYKSNRPAGAELTG